MLIRTASRTVSGSGTSSSPASSRPCRPGVIASLTLSAVASSSTKNGRPSVRSWIARASDGAGSRPNVRCSSSTVSGQLERAQHELLEPARAPQVVAQAADRMLAREAVGAVDADHQQRHVVQRGHDLERRLVAPLQIVEHDRGVVGAGDRREGGAQRLEQRGPVGRAGRLAELGQQQREVAAQRADLREPAGMRAQVTAQHLHQRAVRRRAALHGGAAQDERARHLREHAGEARLADAGVAAHQHRRAVPAARTLEQLLEALSLLRPSDELLHVTTLNRPQRPVAEIRHSAGASTAIQRMRAARARP